MYKLPFTWIITFCSTLIWSTNRSLPDFAFIRDKLKSLIFFTVSSKILFLGHPRQKCKLGIK